MSAGTLDRAAALALDTAPGTPYAPGELWPARMTTHGRFVVLGGPRGYLTIMPVWQRRAILAGRRRVVHSRASVTVLSDVTARWVELFTYDPGRASLDAALRAALRRFELS